MLWQIYLNDAINKGIIVIIIAILFFTNTFYYGFAKKLSTVCYSCDAVWVPQVETT